jgi:drug/metabolite transporter (DMT)-like permease
MDKELLKRLGPLKNQFLVFVGLGLFGLFHYALELATNKEDKALHPYGVILLFIAALIFAATVVFYFYALRNLPGSRLEYMFACEAEQVVKEHTSRMRKKTSTVEVRTVARQDE